MSAAPDPLHVTPLVNTIACLLAIEKRRAEHDSVPCRIFPRSHGLLRSNFRCCVSGRRCSQGRRCGGSRPLSGNGSSLFCWRFVHFALVPFRNSFSLVSRHVSSFAGRRCIGNDGKSSVGNCLILDDLGLHHSECRYVNAVPTRNPLVITTPLDLLRNPGIARICDSNCAIEWLCRRCRRARSRRGRRWSRRKRSGERRRLKGWIQCRDWRRARRRIRGWHRRRHCRWHRRRQWSRKGYRTRRWHRRWHR